MDEQLIRSLREERDRLRAELQTDPRHRQIELIEALLAVVPDALGKTIRGTADTVASPVNGAANGKHAPSKASLMESAVIDLLREHGKVHRTVILTHLTSLGLPPGKAGRMAQLAPF